MPFDIDLRLTPDVRAPEVARRSLAALRTAVGERVVEEAMLLVSELVTNSVRHAALQPDQTIGLRIGSVGHMLRVEVSDPGPGFEPAVGAGPNGLGGWGLWLLDRVAARWGVSRDHGSRVWFELDAAVSHEQHPGRTRPA